MADVSDIVDDCNTIRVLLQAVQVERTAAMSFLQKPSNDHFNRSFESASSTTLTTARAVKNWPETFKPAERNTILDTKELFIESMVDNHQNVSQLGMSSDAALKFYNDVNSKMIATLASYIQLIETDSIWKLMLSWMFLIRTTENQYIVGIIGGNYFLLGELHYCGITKVVI